MAIELSLNVRGQEFEVSVLPRSGNSRDFYVPSIPLTGTVERVGPNAGEIRYSSVPPVEIEPQELYTPDEFDKSLDDEEMPSHVTFVINAYLRQKIAVEGVRSEVRDNVYYTSIEHDLFRQMWFDTGGTDLWGDASDEELAEAEGARMTQIASESDNI